MIIIEEFDQELHLSINQIFANKSFSLLNFSYLELLELRRDKEVLFQEYMPIV